MRKLVFTLVAAGLVLSACSKGPKDTVLPSDPKQWSESGLKDSIEKLSPDDRKLLGAYMIRMGIGGALTGKTIPEGTTIGQAIEEEKKYEAGQGQ